MINLTLVDHDAAFALLARPPIIVNDIADTTVKGRRILDTVLATVLEGEVRNTTATCSVGCAAPLHGRYYLGTTCESCGAVVTDQIGNGRVEPQLWFRTPHGVPKLINPFVLWWLRKCFKHSTHGFCPVSYLVDPLYKVPIKELARLNGFFQRVEKYGRGFKSFIANFEAICYALIEVSAKKASVDQCRAVVELLLENREKIFPSHIPIPNKMLLVCEHNVATGTHVSKTVAYGLDAIRALAGIDVTSKYQNRGTRLESQVYNAILNIADFEMSYFEFVVAGSEGIYRNNIFSNRFHFSARCVITSISSPHNYEVLHIPWAVGVNMLRMHLLGKLYALGYTHARAVDLLENHTNIYHPLLDDLFKEMISETKWPGIPFVVLRNPSQHKGSNRLVFITLIKPNVKDPTISTSLLTVNMFNADFDGDEFSGYMPLDDFMTEEYCSLRVHTSINSMASPDRIVDAVSIPEPDMSTCAHFLHTVSRRLEGLKALCK